MAVQKKKKIVTKKKAAKKKARKTTPEKTSTKKKKTRRNAKSNSSVAAKNRRERVEALIDEKRAAAYLKQWDECGDDYNKIIKFFEKFDDLASALKLTSDERIALNNILMPSAEIRLKALKEKVSLNEKRLRKVFPDLKAVEHSDPEGNNPFKGTAVLNIMSSGDKNE